MIWKNIFAVEHDNENFYLKLTMLDIVISFHEVRYIISSYVFKLDRGTS